MTHDTRHRTRPALRRAVARPSFELLEPKRFLAATRAGTRAAEVTDITRAVTAVPATPATSVPAPSSPSNTDSTVVIDPGIILTPVTTAAPVVAVNALQGYTISAGHAFHVEATGTIIPGADIEDASFAWDFGDTGSAYNQMPGFNAAHVYDQPGVYNVTVNVTAPNGIRASQSVQVTVTPSATVATLFVSADGSDANDGQASDTPVKTLARAVALANNDTTILLRRGDTFVQTSTVDVKRNGITLSAYGTPSNGQPKLLWAGSRDRNNILILNSAARNITVRGLTFDSIYNGDTEQTGMPTAMQVGGTDVTIRDNTFLNIGYCINSNGAPTGMLVQDNRAPSETGVRDYLVWTQGTDIVIVGNQVANSTREHNVRVGGADRLNISFNKLTNLDRAPQGDSKDNAKGTIACQKGSFAYIANNQLRGPAGVGPLGAETGVGEKWARFVHARVQDNVQYNGGFYVQHGADHVTIVRNTIFYDYGAAFDVLGWNPTYQRGDSDVTIDANVAVNYGTYGNFLSVEAAVQGITLTHNVYVAPYLVPGAFNAAAVFVNGPDLSWFNRIDANTWPSPMRGNGYARGGIVFVDTTYSSIGHKTPAEWNALPQVGDDLFMDLTLDSAYTRAFGILG